jgi:peptide/nickel transport system substrate-binding protein
MGIKVHTGSTRHRRQGRRHRLLALAAVLVVVGASCGDDDDGGGADATASTAPATEQSTEPPTESTDTAAGSTSDTSSETTTSADEPIAGGEATVLVFNEIAGLDPVTGTGAAGADGQRLFALYGALVVYDPSRHEPVPVLAEALEPDADFTGWTLTLRDGLEFSDGTPFDAAAVQANWQRAQVPENRSQAIGLASTISTMTVVDAQTLQVELVAPNAHFDNGIARQALNYIASPAAIAGGGLAAAPVGAGPFVLDEWTRDDRMVLVPNEGWLGSDGPYVDRLVFRVIGDEQQRIDTFVTGDADLAFTPVPESVQHAMDEGAGGYASVDVSGGGTVAFNTTTAPFDDPRVRRAVAVGVDAAIAADVVRGEGTVVATNPMRTDSPWFTSDADYPPYDPAEAQRLFDEYAAEHGGSVSFTLGAFQQTENTVLAEFLQTSLNQYDGVSVEVDVADSATAFTRVLQGDFQAHLWGFPVLDPDPGLYNALHSGLPTNITRYADPEVDRLLEEARVTADNDARAPLYHEALTIYTEALPFWHTLHPSFGYVYAAHVHDVVLYEDGNLRSDLLWVEQ